MNRIWPRRAAGLFGLVDWLSWNYAKDLDRQARELKAEHKHALKALGKQEKAAAKARASAEDKRKAAVERTALAPVLDQFAVLEAALAPYEQIKAQLANARARYRMLTNEFVNELKVRCGALSDEQKQARVLELFALDVQAALNAAVAEKRQALVRFIEGLWDKYRVTMAQIENQRDIVSQHLQEITRILGYV